MQQMRDLLERTRVNSELLEKAGENGDAFRIAEPLLRDTAGQALAQVLKRPEVQIEQLAPVLARLMPVFFAEKEVVSSQSAVAGNDEKLAAGSWQLATAVRNELKSVETEIKYAGYLDQQTKSIERLKKAEQRTIPDWFDYGKVSGLSREMNEKLTRVRPRTLGQASRIPGVTPAAVSLINVYIEIQARQQAACSNS
jgi:tRNA uridine 5-carboxymethylaminomethyl modification enzyme